MTQTSDYNMTNDDPQEEAFWHLEQGDSTREYAERVGKPYMFCYNRLRELEDLGLIYRSKVGPRRTIWNFSEDGWEIKEDLVEEKPVAHPDPNEYVEAPRDFD